MQTMYFYDLETSGVNPRDARVMQFAGQRTDMSLKPVGDPHNILIKMTEDTLPQPDAVLVTGITPQKTIAEGISEAEFLKIFWEEVATEDTIFVGYNNVRFDDEFMRFMQYRNFYDPYEWQWKDGRSRWDLLDVMRMTRALRPEGIKWPYGPDGSPSNRLELLTDVNNLTHANAHDALSDVQATIDLAKLVKQKQPKLFDYLLKMRSKDEVRKLIEQDQPFIYSSGKYPNEREKTAIVSTIGESDHGSVLVYDLHENPQDFENLTDEELLAAWQARPKDDIRRLPVKTLKPNRCPVVAPLGVLDEPGRQRLDVTNELIKKHLTLLKASSLPERCVQLAKKLNQERSMKQAALIDDCREVDTQLYDGFIPAQDKTAMSRVRAADSDTITELTSDLFKDKRLQGLLPLYKARNYTSTLSVDERAAWDEFRAQHLLHGAEKSRVAQFMKRLQELAENAKPETRYLLEELQLYAESIMPVQDDW